MDDFKKDLEQNKRESDRAEKFKLKNGDNRIIILTNPVGFSTVFGLGMVYEGAPYGKYGGRKYKCYILDTVDNQIKITDFSYTTANKISALSEGTRTAFTGFPMPYEINLKTDKASTKEVSTDVLAMGDYPLSDAILEQLGALTPIRDIIDSLKKWQKKQVEENPEMKQKVQEFLNKKQVEEIEYQEKKKQDAEIPTIQIGNEEPSSVDYPEDDIDINDIPF